MKKRVLIIFTGSMEIGGIERSLLGLLSSINYEMCEVDLFLYGHYGTLFHLIDKRVNILPEVKELAFLRESFGTKLRNGCYYSALLRLRDEILGKFIPVKRDETWAKIMRKKTPALHKQYDLAVSFFLPFDLLKEKVYSKVKIGWIHTDYNGDRANRDSLRRACDGLDYIATVSEQCTVAFNKIFPEYNAKLITIENILSKSFIYEQSVAFTVESEMQKDGSIRLLSVGRFCEAKNFDNVPGICKLLRKQGLNVKWYLIGFGSDEALIRQKILEAEMQDYVVILGKKENPYPYMKECDLYVQPSRYEGKCVSVIEAQILNKPVVITNYATSSSQLTDGYDGVIVPLENHACAEGIAAVLRNQELQQQLIEHTKLNDYTNAGEVEKLYHLMGKCD